ncbi:hypothetical protein BVC80_8935g11 [Macleaya cordata]|uniref:Uncharacterized protein n=1 Tax=Macleaya cordata TaxID=56857 RepID=A0A200R854_MACCD|nr:hypothetical protein BVC80_8935g11 [Macleaya cordata]
METHLNIPGFSSILATDMPQPMLDRSDEAYQGFLSFSNSLISNSQTGIIVNSFEALEPGPIKVISKGLCVPDARTPPAYYMGPLNNDNSSIIGEASEYYCLECENGRTQMFCFLTNMRLEVSLRINNVYKSLKIRRQKIYMEIQPMRKEIYKLIDYKIYNDKNK